MRRKNLIIYCQLLLMSLTVSAVRKKEESLDVEEAVYFPIVVDSKTNSYHILNDSFLREKLEFSNEKEEQQSRRKPQYEIVPLKDSDLKSILPSYSPAADPADIKPHQIKSISYKDTSINDKYKVYTGFLPGKSETKYKEETPKYTVSDYLVHKSDQESQQKIQSNRYSENPKYDPENNPSKTNNRYQENPKESAYLPKYESSAKYPELPKQESAIERYTENPRPYQESHSNRKPEIPGRDSYRIPVQGTVENPKPASESLAYRYPEILKEESYKKSGERYPEKPKSYVESTTVKSSNRYSENPKKVADVYAPQPPTAVGFPLSGNRYTENPKSIIESYTPKPYVPPRYVEEAPLETYTPKPYAESPKYVEPYAEKPRPATQNYTPKPDRYPVRYTENPKPNYDTYTPKPYVDTYQSMPANRYPDTPVRYTENPKPNYDTYTPKPYVDTYQSTPANRYPDTPVRYTENPKPKYETYTPKPYVDTYQSTPANRYPDTPVRYTENPKPYVDTYQSTPANRYPDTPVQYTENPKPYIDTYQSTPANRYPDTPVRYTENPRPSAEGYTPKPYVSKPKAATYATPSPVYPPAKYPQSAPKYTENPKAAVESYTQPSAVIKYPQNSQSEGYPRPSPDKLKYDNYPATQYKPNSEYPQRKPYEKRPPGYKPLYGSDHHDGYEIYVPEEYEDSYSAIPGKAGVDYPIFDVPPYTYFNCADQDYPGYYADVEARCQVFHICQADGRANAFLCPNGTMFNQQFFVCDWWYNVNCEYAPALYSLNAHLYDTPYRY